MDRVSAVRHLAAFGPAAAEALSALRAIAVPGTYLGEAVREAVAMIEAE